METPGIYDVMPEASDDPKEQLEELVSKFKATSGALHAPPGTFSTEEQACRIIIGLASELNAIEQILTAYGLATGNYLEHGPTPNKLEELIRKLTDAATDYSRLVEWCLADYQSLATICHEALRLEPQQERTTKLQSAVAFLEIQLEILRNREKGSNLKSLLDIYENGIANAPPISQPDDVNQ